MPNFRLFHKQKKEEALPEPVQPMSPQPQEAEPQSQQSLNETSSEPVKVEEVLPQEPKAEPEVKSKTYLKAMPLRELTDLENIKKEVQEGNILILRITPLAGKSIDDVKQAVNELFAFTESIGGDIARLGEERIVICPKDIRIWREKTQPATSEPLPTAA